MENTLKPSGAGWCSTQSVKMGQTQKRKSFSIDYDRCSGQFRAARKDKIHNRAMGLVREPTMVNLYRLISHYVIGIHNDRAAFY